MRIDYSKPIKSIPLYASREAGDDCMLYSRRMDENKVIHYAMFTANNCFRIEEPYYKLLKGVYEEDLYTSNSKYTLYIYNGVDEIYPSIFQALIQTFNTGCLPRRYKKRYKEVFKLLLEGCINVNATIFGLGRAGFKDHEEPVYKKPLVKITKDGKDAGGEWLASIINKPKMSKAEYNKLYYRRKHGNVIDRCG